MKEPIWLELNVVLALHDRLLAEHGGPEGLRDLGLLESALARPRQAFSYSHPDLALLATTYVAGILRNHPFVDGNKRTGFMAGYIFLARNNLQLTASESAAAQSVLALAAGDLTEEAFADWLRNNTEPR
ncbi:MAG: type II toxin-antitoxin system death-on-curing family toxin [Candidatus Competibacteraceae bacterium]|nr:type II toxin-antitoxin system death-on-curing family toxin [Candidatus Competibacteraceae bacterium]